MSATTLQVLGILFLVSAAVVAILNLKRVANLGMTWLSPPLLVLGIALVGIAAEEVGALRIAAAVEPNEGAG